MAILRAAGIFTRERLPSMVGTSMSPPNAALVIGKGTRQNIATIALEEGMFIEEMKM